MNYDKQSFLSGIAVGRQLKGWSTGGHGGPGVDWEGPYVLTPINCDPGYPNKIYYYTRGEDYYFYVDVHLNVSTAAYTDTKLTEEGFTLPVASGEVFAYCTRSGAPAALFVQSDGIYLANRHGDVSSPYVSGAGIYPARFGADIIVPDSTEYWCNYFETETAVQTTLWMRPSGNSFYNRPLYKLPEPVLPVTSFVSKDYTNTEVPITVDSDGFVTVTGQHGTNILFGGISYDKRPGAHKAASFFGDLSRWTWLHQSGATAEITFDIESQQCIANMYLASEFERFYLQHRTRSADIHYKLSFDLTMPDGVPGISYGGTDDYIAVLTQAPSTVKRDYYYYRSYAIAEVAYAQECLDKMKHHFEMIFLAPSTQAVFLCIDMGYILDGVPFRFVLENLDVQPYHSDGNG